MSEIKKNNLLHSEKIDEIKHITETNPKVRVFKHKIDEKGVMKKQEGNLPNCFPFDIQQKKKNLDCIVDARTNRSLGGFLIIKAPKKRL